ncbi:MAG TPA: alpha/beta fold hydrolase [Nocardioidaceae bacterium]|nr:alpha/beta fold hydrolase [Nocardioidaceae bacterium]
MRRALAAVACLAALLGLTPGSAGAADELPVTYNFLVGAVAAGYPFNADPPGANIWTCKPTKAHPRPVILVHGTAGNKNTNWRTYAPLLKNNGYCVYALTYGVAPGSPPIIDQLGGFTSMKGSAEKLAAFVQKVLRSTGARKVDLIGHSQGTIMPAWYVKFLGGARYVRNYVSLAPLWHGTKTGEGMAPFAAVFGFDEDEAPFCTACAQFGPKSKFMARIRQGGAAVDGVRYTNIMTKYDQLVQPWWSGREKGMRNFAVQDFCSLDLSEHFEIASDPIASVIVLNTLDPERKQKIPCFPVLPYVGPAGG